MEGTLVQLRDEERIQVQLKARIIPMAHLIRGCTVGSLAENKPRLIPTPYGILLTRAVVGRMMRGSHKLRLPWTLRLLSPGIRPLHRIGLSFRTSGTWTRRKLAVYSIRPSLRPCLPVGT